MGTRTAARTGRLVGAVAAAVAVAVLPARLPRAAAAGWLAGLAVLAGVAVVPTRLALGAGSIGCGTVLRPDRTGDLAAACDPIVADHLRATLTVGALLAVLACVPVVAGRRYQRPAARAWAAWAVVFVAVAVAAMAWLATVASVPKSVFFDL